MVDEAPSRAAELTQGAPRQDPLRIPKFTDEAMALICRDIGAPLDNPEYRDRLRAALENAAVLYPFC